MFGMGWQEILLILVIGVLVIGPDQLPTVARTIGKLVAQFKRATNDLRSAVSQEIAEQEGLSDFKQFTTDLQSEVYDIRNSAKEAIDREVEKEEAELRKLESEVKGEEDGGGQESQQEDDPQAAVATSLPSEDFGPSLEIPEEQPQSTASEKSTTKKPAAGQKESA